MTLVHGVLLLIAFQATPPVEARVDTLVVRQMRARRIPGLSLAVVRDGRLVYAKGYGEANLEWHAPAMPETVYLVASVTKQFTATAVMMLVRDGGVTLDDSIPKFISDAPTAWRGITIRHLLTHTAGLKDRFEISADGRLFLDYSTAQMLDAAKRTATDFPPGTAWQYSDQGYFLLGVVIERVTGKTYEQYLRERLFAPLGMTSTTLHDWGAIVPNRADGYSLDGQTLVGSRRRYQFGVGSHYGVQSTVRDLARYDSALASGTLIPSSVLDSMWAPARLRDGSAAEIAGISYGFGWFLEAFNGHRVVHHGGSTGTCMFRLPDDGVSVIVLTNLEQAAGSDPCFIARGVATRYVPAVSIAEAPVIADRDTTRTRRLRGVVEAFARNALDSRDFTEAAFTTLRAAAAQQAAGFAQLGALGTFELVSDDVVATRVVWYRARYAAAVIHYRFVLDARGRVASFQAR